MTLGRLGLAMAALAGYSAGAALAARGRAVPRMADLLLAFGCAAAAAVLAPRLGWAVGVAAAIGGAMALGASAALARPPAAAPPSDAADEPRSAWKRFARRMGNFQARLLLGAMYFVLVTPFALAGRFTADPLAPPDEGASRWRTRPPAPPTLDHARRQS
ncbi:MAG TPA: hypothetical protein VM890_07855 [Longimicrobium sp.]|nr:hypothetical protein [Longimicrobium sp.]